MGSLVSALVSAVNGNSSMPVTASASGNSVVLTGKTTGPSTDYSLSVTTCELIVVNGSPYGPNCPSSTTTATASGANLTGGANGSSPTYDSGTAWVTVNGFQASAGYSQGSTTATVASAIASAFNNSNSSPVNASVSGAALTLTSKQMGAGANYPLTWGASTNQPGTFSQPSFSVSVANLTGGKNAGTAPGTIYNYNVAYAANGDVLTANDAVNGNWTYAYDAFNRLLTAVSSNTGLGCSWVYDRFGNRLQQNPYNGSCGAPQYTSSGGNNRMDGYSYDAAGNLLNDGNHSYAYDAENRVISVDTGSTAAYVYDAAGQRVRKTSSAGTVDYIYDLAGHEVAEVSSAGAWNRGEVYAGGRHLATYDGGTTYFNHVDWLGTERARSNVSGMQCEAVVSLPFGDGTSVTSSCVPPDPSPMHFTGKQRDTETGNDYFGVRYFGSNMGRFMTPDPSSRKLAPQMDPQDWNLYGYARNNPLNSVDPLGAETEVLTLVGHGSGNGQRFNPFGHSAIRISNANGDFVYSADQDKNGDMIVQKIPVAMFFHDNGNNYLDSDTFGANPNQSVTGQVLSIATNGKVEKALQAYLDGLVQKSAKGEAGKYSKTWNNCATIVMQALFAVGLLPDTTSFITPEGLEFQVSQTGMVRAVDVFTNVPEDNYNRDGSYQMQRTQRQGSEYENQYICAVYGLCQ
jgi:RHS repeat-associated protein